ncbi:MAG TPA: TIM barrel protein [Anaerolineales bacterium]|nr:TIM barrel protein [Anaerolineales bacterium]
MTKTEFRFGTVGSPISTPKKPGGSVGAVLHIADLSLSALELGWVRSVRVSEQTCSDIRSAGLERDVLISVHAPYYINLNADEEEWPKSRQRLIDAAHYGYLAGATDIIFHPGSYFGAEPGKVLPLAIQRLGACVDELRSKDNPVILRPETMGKSAMLGSLEDTLQMSLEIPGVQPCLDFAHLHARPGDGSMNTYDEWARLLERYGEALGADALNELHIHLSGIEYSSKGEKNHLALEDADLDIEALFRALRDFQAKGRILCESPVLEEDALKMQQLWSEIASSGGSA